MTLVSHPRARLMAATASLVLVTSCATTSESDAPPADAPSSQPAAAAEPVFEVTGGDLDAALAGPWRKEGEAARDVYRHPKETLAFFNVDPTKTVIEIWPGGGWYTAVLAPYFKGQPGKLMVAGYDPSADTRRGGFARGFKKRTDAHPEVYGEMEYVFLDHEVGKMDLGEGVADVVVTFRNTHNKLRGKDPQPAAYFAAMAKALKPGGVFGMVQHRAPEHHPRGETGEVGYVKESLIIRLAHEAGLVLEAESAINANPNDTADYEGGVWTLPPSLSGGDAADRDRYLAIGESDRMTLRFIKPTSPDAAVTTFWVGQSQVSSPDGKTPFGPPQTAMAMRTVRQREGIITETVLDQGVLRTVMMKREGDGTVFKVAEAEGFAGDLDFTGHESGLDGWSYALSMSDGSGTITGTASIKEGVMSTDKVFTTPDGQPGARIRERLEAVDAEAFWAQLKEATKHPPPTEGEGQAG